MAEILDERFEDVNDTNVEFENLDEPSVVEQAVAPVEQVVEQQPDEEDLPEKYKGKSAKELVRMHQEAEKMMGKHSSEVGELRSIVDSFIKTQLKSTEQEQPTSAQQTLDELDFYTDPKKAVEKAIESNPYVQEAQKLTVEMKRQAVHTKLQQAHPDYMNIAQDSAFLDWVKSSPIRTRLLVEADQRYDFDAANELLSTWKERNTAVAQTKQIAEQDRKQALKSANTGSQTRGSAEVVSKKVYRRADLINLLQTNPDRYYAMSDEIQRAYLEGRVK